MLTRSNLLPSFVVASPPINLTVELAGTNNISVSWTATASGPAIIKFWIYYQAQEDRGAVDLDATSTEYIISNCTIGQQYNITVVALSENLPSTVVGPESFIIGEICMIILVPFCILCIGVLVLQMVHVIISLVKHMYPKSTFAFSIYLLPLLSRFPPHFFLLTLSSFSPLSLFFISLHFRSLFPLSYFPPSTLVIDSETTIITCFIIKHHETLCFHFSA